MGPQHIAKLKLWEFAIIRYLALTDFQNDLLVRNTKRFDLRTYLV